MHLTVDAEAWRPARIADAGLSNRARAVLTAAGVETFGDLADAEEATIRDAERCGKQTFGEIVDTLARVMAGGPVRRARTLGDVAREKLTAAPEPIEVTPEPVEEAPQEAPQDVPASPSINPEVADPAPAEAPQAPAQVAVAA